MLYQATSEINFETTSGVSLKCGGNVLTIDGSGIHFKTPNYTQNSGNSGVCGVEVPKVAINKAIHTNKKILLSNKWNANKLLNTIGNGSKTKIYKKG